MIELKISKAKGQMKPLKSTQDLVLKTQVFLLIFIKLYNRIAYKRYEYS